MTKNEHFEILKKGVKYWNNWKKDAVGISPDLSRLDLRQVALKGVDLSRCNLSNSILTGMDLSRIDFDSSDLSYVDLSKAKLSDCSLNKVNLTEADLSQANLERVNMHIANLKQANLFNAEFCGAQCRQSHFERANLNKVNFSRSEISVAKFINCDLRDVNFFRADMIGTDFSSSDITGSNLFGTARDGWTIDNIKCSFFHLGSFTNPKQKRIPANRDFEIGEFESLYKQLPTIEFAFENGFSPIDPFLINQVVESINAEHPEYMLNLDSIHSRFNPRAIFTIKDEKFSEEALYLVKSEYELKIRNLEENQESLIQIINKLSHQPEIINVFAKELTMGDKYEAVQVGAQGPNSQAHDITFNLNEEKERLPVDLQVLSKELSALRNVLQKSAKSAEDFSEIGLIADAEIQSNNDDSAKVISILSKIGKKTLEIAEKTGIGVAVAAIKSACGI